MLFSVIVPTLNEATYVGKLLESLNAQTIQDFQTIIVDGGSIDGTIKIAESLGATVFVQPDSSEFAARNYGAKHSEGSTLVFTCADVMFPAQSLERLALQLEDHQQLAAVTGPDIPYDGRFGLKVLYSIYNLIRFVTSTTPYPLKRFSTSTNFLAIRRDTFNKIGGFQPDDVNADGIMGRTLSEKYQSRFDTKAIVYISARRAQSFGLRRFILHYSYVLENFIPQLSAQSWFQRMKSRSSRKHRELHGA